MARTNAKDIIKSLRRHGYLVQSYKPDRQRLYQVGIPAGSGFRAISPYMTAGELKMFYYGLMAGMGKPLIF